MPLNVTLSRLFVEDNRTQLVVHWRFDSNSFFISSYTITLSSNASAYSINVTNVESKLEYKLNNLTAGEIYSATVQSRSAGGAPAAFSPRSASSPTQRTGMQNHSSK